MQVDAGCSGKPCNRRVTSFSFVNVGANTRFDRSITNKNTPKTSVGMTDCPGGTPGRQSPVGTFSQ
jgi:hypothetical protein